MNKMTLGKFIKQYREDNNLSLREFSNSCELSHSYISKLEKGVDSKTGKPVIPTVETIKKLSDATNVSMSDLLTLSDMTFSEEEWKNRYDEQNHFQANVKLFEQQNTLNNIIKKATPMFDKLNEDGKKEALKRIEELTEISKYTNKENNQIAIAAHNDDNTKEQLKLMQQDVDEL